MSNTPTIKFKPKLYGLIRDSQGRPKIDGNPEDLSPEIKSLLTSAEKQELGIE